MYMLVFVTLMVALIGAYTQIYMKQAAFGIAQQSGVSSAMVVWHATAVDLASKYVKLASYTLPLQGCTLTAFPAPNPVPAGLVLCGGNGGSTYVGMPVGALRVCSSDVPAGAPPCVTSLPNGYSTDPYTFYSIVFQVAGPPVANYVLTFIPPPPAISDAYNAGSLCLPGRLTNAVCDTGVAATRHAHVSTTFSVLYKEMAKNPLLSPMNFGTVADTAAECGAPPTVSCLVTPPVTNPASVPPFQPLVYRLPNLPTAIPRGSIGIITQIQACAAATC